MKKFTPAEMEIVEFEAADVISTSTVCSEDCALDEEQCDVVICGGDGCPEHYIDDEDDVW